jgi:carnitine-CoA ligase
MKPIDVLRLYPPHDGTLASVLDARVAVAPDRPFIVFGDHVFTYEETARAARDVTGVFEVQGIQPGDRIAVMSRNEPSTLFVFLAAARLGAVLVPLNPEFGVAEAKYVLEHSQPRSVLCSHEARHVIDQAYAPEWLLETDGRFDGPFAGERGHDPIGSASDTCVFIYTSGTTGFPKGVMHSQRNVVLAGEGFVERMHLQPDDRLLCVLPMFHVNALFYSFAGALAAGATLILEPKFSASNFWRRVHETGATECNTLAAVTSILMRRDPSEYVPGHSLRKIYGAPFTPETYDVFRERLGVPTLIEGYGMSEVPGVLNNPFEGPHRVGSMGKPSKHPDHSMPFAEVRIVDEELQVRTPIVMQGYYRDPDATTAAFVDGWFLTGDLARRDDDGYFWFIARKKDIIRKRGENISGSELDRVIGEHPSVIEAAAIPVPSELGEDDILVAIVAREPMEVSEIAAWCRARLAPIKVPRYVVFVEALPKTATHRVEKYKMRNDPTLRARAIEVS